MVKALDPQDLDKAKDLNARYAKVFSELGQITVKIEEYKSVLQDLEKERANLLQDYQSILTSETALATEFNEKYGEGTIDLESGMIALS